MMATTPFAAKELLIGCEGRILGCVAQAGPSLPELPPMIRREFQQSLRLAAQGESMDPQPWVFAEPFEDPGDDAVRAAVFAVQLDNGEPWLLRGVLRLVEGGPPILSRVSVEHFGSAGVEVTSTAVRFPLARVRGQALGRLREKRKFLEIFRDAGWEVSPEEEKWAREIEQEAEKLVLSRGPQGYPRNFYRRLAIRHVELVKSGRRDVLKALADEESERLKRRVPRETIRDWIRKATELEFLAPGNQGVAEARPGPNLYRKEHDG